jgi:hypothetical protein
MLSKDNIKFSDKWFRDWIEVFEKGNQLLIPFNPVMDNIFEEYLIEMEYGFVTDNPPNDEYKYYEFTEKGLQVYLFYHL